MKKLCHFFVAVMLVSLASCHSPRYMYTPAAQNVPVFKKQGDSKLAAYYSTSTIGTGDVVNSVPSYNRGLDLQGAVAITDHFAVMGNYYRRWEKNGGEDDEYYNDTSVLYYKRELAEAGLGYFSALDEKKKIIFQLFAGGALGKFSFDDFDLRDHLKNYHQANVSKLFLQPAIQFAVSNNFAVSVSTRLTNVYYSKIKTSYTADEIENYDLDDLNLSAKLFIEPAVTCNFGFTQLPGLHFEGQLGLAILYSQQQYEYRKQNISLGIVADIGKLIKGK